MSFVRRLLGRGDDKDPGGGHVHSDEPVPGWDAISARLAERYGAQEPMHWGTIVRWRMGGPDPLDGISAYRHDGPPRHWHYVSFGLSELYEKESDDPEQSGWGIELTFRLAMTSATAGTAPIWPASFLQNLARYVFGSGNVLWPGHHMDGRGPIAADEETDLTAAVFVEDPELGAIDSPHGSVRFVQVVGTTQDEYDAIRRWDTDRFVELLREGNPLLVSDLDRRSILTDPAIAARVEHGQRVDGSTMDGVFVDRVGAATSEEGLRLTFGALALDDLRIMLDGRLALGRSAFIEGPDMRVTLAPGEELSWHDHGERVLGVVLPPEAVRVIRTIPTMAGRYTWPEAPGLTIEVEQSVVRDSNDREVGRIG